PRRVRRRSRIAFGDEGWLPQRELRNPRGELASRLKGEGRTGGRAIQERRSTSFVDEGIDILDLALDRVRRRVPTVAATPTVVIEHGEVWREKRRHTGIRHPIDRPAAHQDDRRSLTQPIERDRGAVF